MMVTLAFNELIKQDKLEQNQNFSSAPLLLFDTV